MQINFKKFFDDEIYITGRVMKLIDLTQKNIDNNNNNQQKERGKQDEHRAIKWLATNS